MKAKDVRSLTVALLAYDRSRSLRCGEKHGVDGLDNGPCWSCFCTASLQFFGIMVYTACCQITVLASWSERSSLYAIKRGCSEAIMNQSASTIDRESWSPLLHIF